MIKTAGSLFLLTISVLFCRCIDTKPRDMSNGQSTESRPQSTEVLPEPEPQPEPEPKPEFQSQLEADRIVISKETFLLTVYGADDVKIAEYPVAVGSNYGNKKKSGDHKTPEGTFQVQQIQDATSWTHDFGDGKGEIAGAYGSHFIRLLTPPHKGIGIHGTHNPASIGTRATEGCIRLRNEDLLKLVKLVYKGLPVTITGSEQDHAADDL